MDNVYCYITDLPDSINEMVCPCCDGYTVWISSRLDIIGRRKALIHALNHINKNDFAKSDVQEIEGDMI